MADEKTIFEKIIDGEIPADKVYEDDKCLAFKDVKPAAPIHILLIPKKKIRKLSQAQQSEAEVLGHMMVIISKIAKEQKLDDGFRLVINDGKLGGQEVHYLHMHIIGGIQCTWPPGVPLKGTDE